MRILFIHEKLGFHGGAESNVFATATELQERGHEVSLAYREQMKSGSVEWFDLFDDVRTFEEALSATAFVGKHDLVYVHKCSDLNLLASLKNSQVPIVRMIHDHELYCMKGSKYSYWNRNICTKPLSTHCIVPCGAFVGRNGSESSWLPFQYVSYARKKSELELNKTFDQFIVASEYMKIELINNGFDEGKIAIHPPVPLTVRPFTKWQHEDRVFLYVGQITRGKGVDILLQALAELPMRFQCFIVGEGNFRGACEQLAKDLQLDQKVFFTGFINPDELHEYYSVANLLVVSSVWPEPFGLVGLEAMNHKLPIVSFDVGGVHEWMRHGFNGLICREKTPHCLAENIKKIVTNKELSDEMGRNGKMLLDRQFSLKQYIDGIENIMENLISQKCEGVPV